MSNQPPSESVFAIPSSSFTAFRLTYGSSRDISEVSKCILLGGLPEIWWEEKKPSYLKSTSRYAKRKVKKRFNQAVTTVNASIRSGSNLKVESNEDEAKPQEGGFNLFLKGQKKCDLVALYNEIEQELNQEDDNDVHNHSMEQPALKDTPNDSENYDGSTFDSSKDHMSEHKSPVINYFNVLREQSELGGLNHVHTCESANSGVSMPDEYFSSQFTIAKDLIPNPVEVAVEKSSNSLQVYPNTEVCSSIVANAQMEREKHLFLKKLKIFANASKNKGSKKRKEIKKRIGNVLLRRYQPGEVVSMDKMLVLVKEVAKKKNISQFSDKEPCDSRVYERWKEYFVVLRKTDSLREQIIIQFYDIHNSTNQAKSGPEFSVPISNSLSAQFYSGFDKSICLTAPREGGIFIYILRCRDQFTSFRWLHFVRRLLDYDWQDSFHVNIPELSISLKITIPESLFLKKISPTSSFEIKVLAKGYQVKHNPVIQYLKDVIIGELKAKEIPNAEDWLEKNTILWFCFKSYDRLEWIMNNGHLFFMQYQLLHNSYQLQLREMGHCVRSVPLDSGMILEEPYPIEGFLSRLTDSLGTEGVIRNYYKLSYFYTVDNILFFTKYFRAVPPSPNNEFMDDESSKNRQIVPLTYEHSPFPIDENEHITWLKPESFEYHDQLALREFERRSQQVIKAEGLVNLCLIKEIRPISLDKIRGTNKLALCFLWYSDVTMFDKEEIVDSAFEIEMCNGCVLKLQAPNREIRDQWIKRLIQLKEYWIKRKDEEIKKIIKVRDENIDILKINEYIDSNIVQETNQIEIKNSVADSKVHSIEGISMPKSVLVSGYLFQKSKKHSNFNQCFVVLCPGFLMLFSIYKRSKKTGISKKNATYKHYLTIPISECYVYSGNITTLDLLERQDYSDSRNPGQHYLSRIYPDGWKSSEEECMRCFTLWFGKRRQISNYEDIILNNNLRSDAANRTRPKNPNLIKLTAKLGFTGKSFVFMARSRQEREIWVSKLYAEINRLSI